MNEQLSFLETSPRRAAKYNLFLAIFPDSRTAQHIAELANKLHQARGMKGRTRPVDHLHVTLLFFGGFTEISESVIETISRRGGVVAGSVKPFEISFNRVLSFRGKTENHPVVLVAEERENETKRLHRLLHAEFSKPVSSATASTPPFVPHVTLLYDRQELAALPIEPVTWTVNEVVLVQSEVGATKYTKLACLALGGPLQA